MPQNTLKNLAGVGRVQAQVVHQHHDAEGGLRDGVPEHECYRASERAGADKAIPEATISDRLGSCEEFD